MLGGAEFEDACATFEQGSAGQDLLPEELDGGELGAKGAGPVFELGAGLDGAVIAAGDLAHAGGVAAAADVFEECGVVEVGDGGEIEADGERDADGEEAGADGVAGDGALGEIEGEGEGDEDFLKG